VDTYDFVVTEIITLLNLFHFITVEAISACGFWGILEGLDEDRKTIVLRFPGELRKGIPGRQVLGHGPGIVK
jgi:hypothetical protein